MIARSLLLPVETRNRELDGKLLLALHAAERGWRTTIGKRSVLHDNLQRFPRSVYFSKDLRANNRAMFPLLTALGHSIVGLDEEGLVNSSDEMFLLKMDRAVFSYFRTAFAWGENDARIYRMASEAAHPPVVVTGNPRIDLLRPELSGFFADEVAEIRRKYSHFVLLNSNFAMVNHFIANQTRFRVADWVSEDKAGEMRHGMLSHKAQLLDAFLKLVPRLGEALHPYPLIIRPHPSENRQTWHDAASGLENVHVVHEGNVASWLKAADALIHNGCTSAVEAAVLGTPAFSFRPVKQPEFDNDLPNGLSIELETVPDLVVAVAETAADPRRNRHRLDPKRQALLARHIAALDGPLACERLMDEIDRSYEPAGPLPALSRRLIARLRLALRRNYRHFKKRSPTARGNRAYLRHKFPPISVEEVNERIGRIGRALGRFEHFGAEEIIPDLFRIVERPVDGPD